MWKQTAVLSIVVQLALVAGAAAEGAVAIAEPKDVARDGYAFGLSGNFRTPAEAEAGAMTRCRETTDAPAETRQLCRIVHKYRNGCVAGALDPAAGTPGAGWGAGANKAEADEAALKACRETAGPGRIQFCEVIATQCDGSGK